MVPAVCPSFHRCFPLCILDFQHTRRNKYSYIHRIYQTCPCATSPFVIAARYHIPIMESRHNSSYLEETARSDYRLALTALKHSDCCKDNLQTPYNATRIYRICWETRNLRYFFDYTATAAHPWTKICSICRSSAPRDSLKGFPNIGSTPRYFNVLPLGAEPFLVGDLTIAPWDRTDYSPAPSSKSIMLAVNLLDSETFMAHMSDVFQLVQRRAYHSMTSSVTTLSRI